MPPRRTPSPALIANAWLALVGSAFALTATLPHAPATTHPTLVAVALNDEPDLADPAPALLERYCLPCHGPDRAEKDLRLDTLLASETPDTARLRRARKLLAWQVMPPEDPLPTDDERRILTNYLDGLLGHANADTAPIDPGWYTIHRLNRAEYRNTLRDLLGIDPAKHDLAASLPPDDIGYGFDNIADVLTMSPLQMEAYLDAAEHAVELALGPEVAPDQTPRAIRSLERRGNGRELPRGGHMLYSTGAVAGSFDFPATGLYELRVEAWETHAGDEAAALELRLDERRIDTFRVNATTADAPSILTTRLRVNAGRHDVAARFTNDYYVPDVADRNLAVLSITVAGPLTEDSIERPDAWTRVIFERPSDLTPETVAASLVIDRFASNAFRRPATEPEIDALMTLYDRCRAEGDSYERAIRTTLSAILVSPGFLYRAVANPAPDDPNAIHRLSGHELASRLSYFLWSTMPDQPLRDLAERALLTDDDTLRAQVRRMLDDPRADAFIENFAGQWLLLRNLDALDIDRERFPDYDDALRADMIAEATRFFADVVRSDRSALDLIDSPDAFLNERLARLYDIQGVTGPELRRVTLPEDSPRGGILTTGAVLTVTSNPTRTSPVKRGLYVLDQILGTPPPPPPPDIPPLVRSEARAGPNATLREQLAVHVADATCRACHQRMDPIGLAMENFDAIGRWRDQTDGRPIDATGTLPGPIAFDGPIELKRLLRSREDQFIDTLTRKVLTYALGRGLEPFDAATVDRIASHARANDDRLRALIEEVVLSDAFRSCRARSTP